MLFPTIRGSNLLREHLTLPKDFQGELNLVFIAFEQWQQMEVDSWLPLAEELENSVTGLNYYELPTIQTRNTLYQWFINEGMRAGIPNQKSRQRTITLYLDKRKFRKALGFQDEEHIYILMVNKHGEVIYQARGSHSQESEVALRQIVFHDTDSAEM
jgi:hypothetical protein